ncbi:hypothetical protein [Agrobacterium tumefaciens]|uniref:hypothetical protein n=1 Tax=Agrobacterium tumefaciens TaxID=358 RepID=UPI0015746CDA|nr:hypothetical protein [Agrobacterium tumefaciens]NTD84354.1 hypothetical protein [Agrobacterium tumefaciens]NTD94670.1 hypothetical protein [Agrobacterium tumefaciens]NTD96121.1 hypothetical protein [Agrobacterium tumefaciens]NTE13980.1 hypothetical protein [Agrobacterium tumefaciens]NTE19594.1 hypothetical protein [Agrobacterium tumefaciens]
MEATRIDVTAHVRAYLEGFRAAFQMANEMLEEELRKDEAPAEGEKPFEMHYGTIRAAATNIKPETDEELAARIKRLWAKQLI